MTTSHSDRAIGGKSTDPGFIISDNNSNVPEALITLLTSAEDDWEKVSEEGRCDLIEWLSGQVTQNEATFLVSSLQLRGLNIVGMPAEFLEDHPSSRPSDDVVPTITERLKIERRRLGLSVAELAALTGVKRAYQIGRERGDVPLYAESLAAFDKAGADVLFIVTGRRAPAEPIRQALGRLDRADRHHLLLDLLAEELRG